MTIPANTQSGDAAESALLHKRTTIIRAVAFAIVCLMFLPVMMGRIFVCDDLLNYHLPIRQFYAQCLAEGHSFDWMPGLFSGFFLTGSGQAGTYHPLHWLLYRWLPLPLAFGTEIIVSYPFMLLGMKLFLQRHLRRADAAWLGAIVFTFSGFCTLHFLHPNAIAVVAHLPWLLLSLDILLRPEPGRVRTRVAAELGVAFLTGSQLLLGYPQYVWFSLLAESVYCLGFVTLNGQGIRLLTQLTLLKSSGMGVGAVQLLPSMDALADSDRTLMPDEYFFQHPLTAFDMLQWVNPFLTKSRVFGISTHELGVYCGSVSLLLATLALSRMRTRAPERRLLLVMLSLGLIALWLSFGRAGGLYIVQTWLPLVGKFRWPSRITVLMHFVVAVFAAVGYLRLTSDSAVGPHHQLSRRIWLLPALSVMASGLVYLIWPHEEIASWSLLLTGPLLFVLAAVLVKDLSQGKWSPALIVLLAGDLAVYGFTYEAMNHTRSYADILSELKVPPGDSNDGRIIAEVHLSDVSVGFGGNELLLAGWKQADGYEGLLPQCYLLNENISLDGLRISGVRWIVNSGRHSSIPGLLPTSDNGWLEVPGPLPRVRLTGDVRTIADPAVAVKALSAQGPVIVESDVSGLSPSETIKSVAEISLDQPGEIVVRTQSSSAQLMVLSERYSRGWQVFLDDVPAAVVRAEVDFMACKVPPGSHVLHFVFRPSSVRVGRMVSVGTALLLLLCGILRLTVQRHTRTVSASIGNNATEFQQT